MPQYSRSYTRTYRGFLPGLNYLHLHWLALQCFHLASSLVREPFRWAPFFSQVPNRSCFGMERAVLKTYSVYRERTTTILVRHRLTHSWQVCQEWPGLHHPAYGRVHRVRPDVE